MTLYRKRLIFFPSLQMHFALEAFLLPCIILTPESKQAAEHQIHRILRHWNSEHAFPLPHTSGAHLLPFMGHLGYTPT